MDERDIDLEMARARTAACTWSLVALALAVTRDKPPSLRDVIEMLELTAAMVSVTTDKAGGELMLSVAGHLRPYDGPLDPKKLMAANIAAYLDAGPERRDALREWLRSATTEEIASDLQALFDKLSGTPPRDPPA